MKTPERGRSVASYGLRGKIYKRSRFFYGLPYEKQIILLRRTKNMTNTSTEFAQKLSDELHLSFQSVASWLSRKRLKNMRILQNPGLTPVKTQLLRELFQLSNELNEEKALLFGYELELPADTVRKWFECEKLNATRHHFICYEDDELPTGEAASNEISVSLDVDNSCSPVGTEMMDVSSEDTEKFLFSKSVALKISKYRNKFFYGLPFAKQIALLENSRYLTTNHVNLAQKLSSRLNLPFENVFSWLSRKRYRNLKLLESTKVTPYQNLLLEDEFQLSNALDEKRVLMLSYELELPVDKIQEWFDYQRSRSVEKNVSTEDSDCEEQRQNFETSDS